MTARLDNGGVRSTDVGFPAVGPLSLKTGAAVDGFWFLLGN